ncbi:MAG: zf-HC2 domain-containing protein [Chthonomonadales bacterium]|nr:zf-HC2 domain-containing protein [Chthonomonadales bacterium]
MSTHRTRCKAISALLPAYLEHELSRDETALVREHLERCPVCRADAQRADRALGILRSVAPAPMPDVVRVGLHARIANLESPRLRVTHRLRYAGAAATAALAVACVAYLGFRPAHDARNEKGGIQRQALTAALTLPAPEPTVTGHPDPPAASREPARVSAPPISVNRVRRSSRVTPSSSERTGLPASFLDVTDQRGISARMLLAERERMEHGGGPGYEMPAPVLPSVLRDRRSGEWADRVRIGDTVTELHGTAERDASGRLRAIRVAAETLRAESAESLGATSARPAEEDPSDGAADSVGMER